MKITEFSSALAGHPFVKGMSEDHLRVLSELALPVHFEAGEYILRRGYPANRFYLINEGRVAIGSAGEHAITQVVCGGEVLGWSWLLSPYEWNFEARTLTPVDAVFSYATPFRNLCEADHTLGYEFMKRAVETMAKRKACQGCGKGPL
jgi:CRP/FNR family transcriptional regulator, cyclic AMP receptor protein